MSTDQANTYKDLGNQAFKESRFQDAVDAFTKAIEINPNDHVFYSNRSGAYSSLKKQEEALEDAIKCVQIKPDWAKGYQRKGHAEYEMGHLKEAISTYKIGLEKEPTNDILKDRLMKVEKELKEGGGEKGEFDSIAAQIMMKLAANPRTAEWLKDPSFMTKLNMLKTSPQMFPVLMKQDPRLSEAFNLLIGDFGGFANGAPGGGANFNFQDKKNADSAEKKPDSKMEEEHEHKHDNCKHGDHKHEGQHTKQETQHTKQETQHTKQETQHTKQEGQHTKQEDHHTKHEDQHGAHKQAQKPKPHHNAAQEAEKIKNEGNDLYKQKNFERALECYDKAIELNPLEVLYYNNKAAAYMELKDYEEALKAVEVALKVAEDNKIKDFTKLAKLFARKGSIFAKQGDLANSITWYQKSLLEDMNENTRLQLKQVEKQKREQDALAYINPDIAEQHNEKAKILFQEGKFPLALEEYNEADKRSPNDPKYLTNRGICFMKLLEFRAALKDFDRVLEIDPKHIKALTKKGNCHFALKEFHKALSCYEKGLEFAPDNQELIDLQAKTRASAYLGTGDEGEQEERAKHAMEDPEIQKILRTPEIQTALKTLQADPKQAAKIMSNPTLAPLIGKLVEAGIIRMS